MSKKALCYLEVWCGNQDTALFEMQRDWLRRGIVHYSEEAARAHAQALLRFSEEVPRG